MTTSPRDRTADVRRGLCAVLCILLCLGAGMRAAGAEPSAAAGGETMEQALCRLIDGAATRQNIPVGFLTALIWQESSFRPNVVSPAGAKA